MSTATLEVAQTILAQLGGNRFLSMTGARHLTGSADTLSFKLPSRGVNYVSIKLEGDDTYTMTFGKLRGVQYSVACVHSGVYCDMLRGLFTRVTGLATSL